MSKRNKLIMKSFILSVILGIILISCINYVSAEQQSLGEYDPNDCVRLIQTCGSCTYNNITSLVSPNSTTLLSEVEMIKSGTEYTYSFCNTSMEGTYIVNGVGDLDGTNTVWAYDFVIGKELTFGKAILNFGFIFVLVIFLVISIIGIFKIENYVGRFVLYWISHILVIAISFMIWSGADKFLSASPFVVGFFRIIFYFVMIGAFPMMILSLAWIFHIHLVNDDIKKMMERGIDEDEAYDRAIKKRGRRR